MKKLLIIKVLLLVLVLGGITVHSQVFASDIKTETGSNFNQGWIDGYCEGWRDVKGQNAICPITPIPPIPPIGQDTYKGGYNMGFKAGYRAADR